MKQSFINLLNFFSLLDSEGQHLSITNLTIYVVIVKIASTHNVSLPDCSALFFALLNVAHRRHIDYQQAKQNTQEDNNLSNQLQEIKTKLIDYDKTFNEAKSVVSTFKLSNGLQRR
jgi:hypothetical protein